jgi:hypothetical protein
MPAGDMTGTGDDDRPMTKTYATVLALEVLVLVALFAAGRYFGSV